MKYYTVDEVVIHKHKHDFWLVINRVVYNLTQLFFDRSDTLNDSLRLLAAYGGKDLSVYFTKNNCPNATIPVFCGDVPYYFRPAIECSYSDLCKTRGYPWWHDPFYMIGMITERERYIRIYNTMTTSVQPMKVCSEDSIKDILEKYRSRYNSHAGSYSWRKFVGAKSYSFDFNKTLEENGLSHKQDPVSLWAYYTDDFTVA